MNYDWQKEALTEAHILFTLSPSSHSASPSSSSPPRSGANSRLDGRETSSGRLREISDFSFNTCWYITKLV